MTLSTSKALLRDYASFIPALFLAVFWIPFALTPFGRYDLHIPLIRLVAVVWTLFFSALLTRRLRFLSRLFTDGRTTTGRITKVFVPGWGDRAPFSYYFSFDVDGQSVDGYANVARFSRRPAFRVGDRVDVLYDPSNPERAVIRQLLQAEPAPPTDGGVMPPN